MSGPNLPGPVTNERHGDSSDNNLGCTEEHKVSIGQPGIVPIASHVGGKVSVYVGVFCFNHFLEEHNARACSNEGDNFKLW